MLRSEVQIVSQTAQLTENFTAKYYEIAARQQRGIAFNDNFNVDGILLTSLDDNAVFDTLSTQQINDIIDTLIA
jgi:hypothetical protein